MKIFLLATCLLIITKVKAIDINHVQLFKEYLEKCEEDSPVGKIQDVPYNLRSDLIFCALKEAGIIDKYDYYGIEEFEGVCNTYMIDSIECQNILFSCYQASLKFSTHVQCRKAIRSDKERILNMIQCTVLRGIMALVPL